MLHTLLKRQYLTLPYCFTVFWSITTLFYSIVSYITGASLLYFDLFLHTSLKHHNFIVLYCFTLLKHYYFTLYYLLLLILLKHYWFTLLHWKITALSCTIASYFVEASLHYYILLFRWSTANLIYFNSLYFIAASLLYFAYCFILYWSNTTLFQIIASHVNDIHFWLCQVCLYIIEAHSFIFFYTHWKSLICYIFCFIS